MIEPDGEVFFNFTIDKPALRVLIKALDKYIEQWPGGTAKEQEDLKDMQTELHKALFELTFLEGEEECSP